MKSKDELKKRSIILPKPPAIQEMGDISGTSQHTPPTKLATLPSKIQEVSTPKPANKEVSGTVVPTAGKDDIALRNRQLPCPKGTLGIIVEVDLPNHVSEPHHFPTSGTHTNSKNYIWTNNTTYTRGPIWILDKYGRRDVGRSSARQAYYPFKESRRQCRPGQRIPCRGRHAQRTPGPRQHPRRV